MQKNDAAYKFLLYAMRLVVNVTKTTTVMELIGIKIAANTGESNP